MHVDFDADEVTTHADVVDAIEADAGPIDIAVLTFGILGDQAKAEADPAEVAALIVAAADGLQQQWLLDRSIDMAARLRRLWDGVVAHSHRAVVTQS